MVPVVAEQVVASEVDSAAVGLPSAMVELPSPLVLFGVDIYGCCVFLCNADRPCICPHAVHGSCGMWALVVVSSAPLTVETPRSTSQAMRASSYCCTSHAGPVRLYGRNLLPLGLERKRHRRDLADDGVKTVHSVLARSVTQHDVV